MTNAPCDAGVVSSISGGSFAYEGPPHLHIFIIPVDMMAVGGDVASPLHGADWLTMAGAHRPNCTSGWKPRLTGARSRGYRKCRNVSQLFRHAVSAWTWPIGPWVLPSRGR